MSSTKTQEKLEMKDILELFTSGCTAEQKIGIEYERIPIFSDTKRAADYYSEPGMCSLLQDFAREDNWDYITDGNDIIGLKQGHDAIMLEPGCQLEMSLEPVAMIYDLVKKINSINKKMKPVLKRNGIELIGYGVSPISTHKTIKLIPKKRYHIMAKYLWGILSDVMMRETAGIQVCLDFENEQDAARKFKIANKLTPFMTAMFANSPIRGGVDTGYKTFRALSWLNTDNERCGFAADVDLFEDYVNYVLNSPIIFINRGNTAIEVNGRTTFAEFMKHGWNGLTAELDDFKLHANLYFPEVRLRKFIEIRNHDCVNNGLQYAIPAIYKGILYNETAMNDIEELFSMFNSEDFAELRYNVPKNALNCKISGFDVSDIAQDILDIAQKSLKNEAAYIDPIRELTRQGLSPADIILKNWHGSWNKDINKLIRHVG